MVNQVGYVLRMFLMQALVHRSTRDGAGIFEDEIFRRTWNLEWRFIRPSEYLLLFRYWTMRGLAEQRLCVVWVSCLLSQELKAVGIRKSWKRFHHCEREIAIYSGIEDSVGGLKATKRASKRSRVQLPAHAFGRGALAAAFRSSLAISI